MSQTKIPPSRNTGVLSEQPIYRYSIDWLRYSVPYWTPTQDILPQWDCFDWLGEVDQPLPNYDHDMVLPVGRIDWNEARPEQKKLVTLRGDDLQELVNQGYSVQELVGHVLRLTGVKVSRLDFAIDIYQTEAKPIEIFQAHREGKCKTRARKAALIDTWEGAKHQGQTCYIGTRESMKFLRVYDKAKESGEVGILWTRAEIELKDEYALVALEAMGRHSIISAGKAVMRQYIETGIKWFDDGTAPDGTGAYVDPVKHKLTDWETWVINVALPAVQEAMVKRVPGVSDGVKSTLKQLYYGHGKPGKPLKH